MSAKDWDRLIKKVVRIQNRIEDAPREAAKEWLEEDFKPYAKSIAPVRTGEFRDSINGRVSKTRVTVFADAPHSRWVEEGTSTNPAQPTIRPALEATRAKLLKRIRDAVRNLTK